ncbi:hypothetical protein RI578_23815 [Streptomyces sp. BB1-1-1]|uniref:hypothetical protein n=1 Tax=Streptomyces sp. BB1-1-1 TaxID=3074430 RepID=UPI0028774BEC|nr:hypothetical protein [Streptomyces sp. BB1-1-1]WND37128.1 hypothetical protein RI578_23815 [Streptomyces sp. BB1-1-1]
MNSDNHSTGTRTAAALPTASFAYPFPDNPLASALAVSDELSAALARHGVTLPSLRPDLASCTTTTLHRPLLELGRVNLSTAHHLTAVLTDAADAREAAAHPSTSNGTGTGGNT